MPLIEVLFCVQPDLDPRARSQQAAVLDALNTALAQNQRTELERKYAVRYHKVCQYPAQISCAITLSQRRCNSSIVTGFETQAFMHACEQVRFFERVKLERQIKQLEKKLDTASSNNTAAELARLRDDLQARMGANRYLKLAGVAFDHCRCLHHPRSCAFA